MLMTSTKTPAQMFYTVAEWTSKDVLPDHTFHKTVMLNDNAPMTYRFINTMIDYRSQQQPVSGCSLLFLHAMDFTHKETTEANQPRHANRRGLICVRKPIHEHPT